MKTALPRSAVSLSLRSLVFDSSRLRSLVFGSSGAVLALPALLEESFISKTQANHLQTALLSLEV